MWDKNFFQDVIIVRYEISDDVPPPTIAYQNTLNNGFYGNDIKYRIMSTGTNSSEGSVNLIFAGGDCNIGIGKITLKKLNNNQISWKYEPEPVVLDEINCPPGSDLNVYLPETENLIFTKQ